VVAFSLPVGSFLNILAYDSIEPLFAAIIFLAVGIAILRFTALGGHFERAMFMSVFSICWFMAGIAAMYANFLLDPGQLYADPANFLWLARNDAFIGLGLEELEQISEGSLAVLVWRVFYDGFAAFGFEKGRYIGILVNIFTVAYAGVIAVKITRLLYGNDVSRLKRIILLFSFCGLFWLFAAIHLRDALVLLWVTSLTYVWMLYLEKPSVRNLIFLIVASLLATVYFTVLRKEFVFVPVVMLSAGLFTISLFKRVSGARKYIYYAGAFGGFIVASSFLPAYLEELLPVLTTENQSYIGAAQSVASADSLGMAFIVNQPLPIRLVIGSVWLFIFPIPFWAGFQLESAYHLFKSFNAIFFYFLIPLFFLAIQRLYRFKGLRTPSLMFNLLLVIGFTPAIAITSMETRHFAAFFVSLFMVALLPDLKNNVERLAYKNLLSFFLLVMLIVHLAWGSLKLF